MTMFEADTANIEKKLQEIEDNDLYSFMKKQGYSEEQIKIAIRNTHLLDAINCLKKFYVSQKKSYLFCKRRVGKKKR